MTAAKKTKQRFAGVAGKKTKGRKGEKNGRVHPAMAKIEKTIAKLDGSELDQIVKKIDKRKEELSCALNQGKEPNVLDDPVIEDWKWIFEQCNAGKLRPYLDQHVAVVNRKIIWHGDNSLKLRESLAKQNRVDAERIVIYYVG